TKVAGKTAKAGANAVANGAKKLSDMRNVLSKQATQRVMPPLQSAQKAYRSSSNYIKKKISQAGDIKLAPKKVRVVEEPITGTRMPVVDEWITGKDVGRMFSVRSGNGGASNGISKKDYKALRKKTPNNQIRKKVNP
ncbi:transposase, partial [Priestia megaterium]